MALSKKELDTAIFDLSNDLREVVSEIESGIKTTQNHYGRYTSLIHLAEDNNGKRLIALALVVAGADKRGVAAAMKIHGI